MCHGDVRAARGTGKHQSYRVAHLYVYRPPPLPKKKGCFEIKAALYGSGLQELRRWKRSESGEDRVTRTCTHK
jgi:hypothetical protein